MTQIASIPTPPAKPIHSADGPLARASAHPCNLPISPLIARTSPSPESTGPTSGIYRPGALAINTKIDRVSAPFSVRAESNASLHTVSVSGELDQSTAPELRTALADALAEGADGGVLVDLSDCRFIDSTGLSLLVEAKRQLGDDERRFGVCCPDADVRRLLELTGIDQAVGLFDTRDEAVAALSNGAS